MPTHAFPQTPASTPLPLDIRTRWLLAILCLCSGIAPLEVRLAAAEPAKIAYSLLLAVLFFAASLFARRQASLRAYWTLPFAFFVFSIVQVLNNSVPAFVGASMLHDTPTTGNPLASTITGTISIQILETLLAIIPIIVLTKASGDDLRTIYIGFGKIGGRFFIAVAVFVAFYILTALIPLHRLFPTNGAVTLTRYFALSPWLILIVIANGFQEEILFRGLFLRKYNALFGAVTSNFLQAVIFSVAHAGVTYTPIALLFILVFVFPLGLLAGYLMRATDGVVAPAIFHAGADIPIYLAFLTYVS